MISNIAYSLPLRKGERIRVPIKGEFIVKTWNIKNDVQHKVLRTVGKNLYLIKTNNEKNLLSTYKKVYQNYEYIGDFKEVISPNMPNDTYVGKQVHHQIIKTFKAWNITKGSKEIIIAVTDNEFQIDHKDLEKSWWTNPDEIPGNGLDDDNNGYIDDVYGWDFIEQDNNVDSYSDPTHGTHVSGIIAAMPNNKFSGTGIAPKIKVMPLKWYGSEYRWTSATIAETYNYAIDNGANIISTSYAIDHLVDDELYRDVLRRAKAEGVLVINSAGNGNKKNPRRQLIKEIILVCSVTSSKGDQDVRSRFSNYGTGIDICAPGDPIFSTVQVKLGMQDRSAELSGTSMATPVVAAVAGLIWSANPNFTAEEVKKRLLNSTDKIDHKNKKYKGMLGSGRVNAFKAIR